MKDFTIYQSGEYNNETSKKNYILRRTELQIIVDALTHRSANDALPHKLILGKRGSGKTTLLKRIEIEIEENLNKKHIPVNLAEEQASIYRLFDLWLEIINNLKSRTDFLPDMKDYSDFDNEQDYTEYLYRKIHEFCITREKQIVLLLDNFDRIVENFKNDLDLLTETFNNYNDVIIIAASTRTDKNFWQHDNSFYERFKLHHLEALTIDEINEFINRWAKSELKKFIAENQGKLQNISIITDSSPRTILLFIQLLVQNNYAHDDIDYVEKIMDNITPIYQEMLNNLPPQFRKMVLEMAFIWEACTTKELVDKCKMESKLISANLKTMSDRGIVDKIETDKRNLLYRISDRFFNMWLIMTQGNQEQKRKAKWLRIFLENWYDINCLKVVDNDTKISKLKKQIYSHTEIQNNKKTSGFAYSAENEDDGFNTFELGSIDRVQTIYSETEKYFLKAIAKGQVSAMYNLGNFYVNQEKFTEAEKYYLLAIKKGHISAMYNLGVLYVNQGKYEDAENYYLSAAKMGDTNSMYNLGLLYVNQGKFEDAEKYYLLASEKGNISAMYNLGNLYANQNKFAEAEKYYLLSAEKRHFNSMYNLGNLYANQGKFAEAEKYYLLAVGNGNVDAMNNLGNLYNNQGKFAEAEKYYLSAVENGNVNAMNSLGIIYYRQDKFAEAEKYYLSAIEKGNVNTMNNLGAMYYNQGKYAEAEKYYLLAIEKNYHNAFYNLASLYYQQNKNKERALKYILQYEGCEDLKIIIELWNGIFNDVEKRTLSVIKEEPDALFWFIIDLLIHQQKAPVLNLFNHPEAGKTLQERYKVLHYVSLILNKKTENNLNLKIPPEIQTTIHEVTEYIVEKEKFYGYRK